MRSLCGLRVPAEHVHSIKGGVAASAGAGNRELTFQPHAGSRKLRENRKEVCIRLHTLKAQRSDVLLPARLYPVKFPQPPGTIPGGGLKSHNIR